MHVIKIFIWDPSNCEFEWDKSCDKKKNRKKLVDKLVNQCTETNNEVK